MKTILPKTIAACVARVIAIGIPFVVIAGVGVAQDDSDLLGGFLEVSDLVTDASINPDEVVATYRALRFRLEGSTTMFHRRVANPSPPGAASSITERLRLVAEGNLPMADGLSFQLNAAVTARGSNLASFDATSDLTLDLREAFLSWQPGSFSLEFGRINIRNGVAAGFNPVDFFRVQDAAERTNLDPTDARQNRLGVFTLRGTYLWESGSASVTLAPSVTGGGSIWHDQSIVGLHLSSTNPSNRILLSATQSLGDGFSPEAYVFYDQGDISYGLAASYPLGNQWLIYGEWSGGPQRRLVDGALRGLRDAGRLAPPLAIAFGPDQGASFKSKATIGASFTSASNIVTSVEYHYNGSGFDQSDWDQYFALANAHTADPAVSGQLASIPLHAALALEPVSRHSLFIRSQFNDIAPDLTLSVLANFSLVDYSGSFQLQANYDLRDDLTLSGRIGGTFGPSESDFGSRSAGGFLNIGLSYHF